MLDKLVLLSVDATAIRPGGETSSGSRKAADASAVALDLQVLLQLHACQEVRDHIASTILEGIDLQMFSRFCKQRYEHRDNGSTGGCSTCNSSCAACCACTMPLLGRLANALVSSFWPRICSKTC
jgi:hypothetical protein